MKKFLYALFAIIFIVACSKSDDGGSTDTPPSTPEKPKTEIKLDSTTSDFATEGGTSKITFTASEAWTAEVINTRADDWCTIEPTSGAAGDAKITVTTTANDTPDDRSASIVIKAGTASKTITVSQKQKDALTVTSSKFEVGAEGGEVAIEVKANIDFEYSIEESAKDWVEYKTTRAMKTSNLVFEVKENDDTDKREAKITISSGEFSEVITIYQAGSEPTIIISQNEYVVSSDGETIAVEVASNVDVAVELPSDADWVTENTTRGMSTNTFYFDIAPSEEYNQRSADIKFTNKDNNLSEVVKIVQIQKDALVIAKDSYTADSDGGQIQIEVGHNVDFDVEISVDWITRVQTRAFTTETITFNVAKNPTNDNREGTIIFKSKDGRLAQTVKVYQAQTDALIISKKDIVVSAESGSVSFEIQTNIEFDVSEPNVSWLRAVQTRGLATHTLLYEYDANTAYDSREAKIVVTDTKNNKSETITITQAQKDAIVLAKSEYEFGVDGGNLDFEIQTNVDVTVTISDDAKDWIQQVETRALETKTLYFNILACSAEEDREGTITISGGNATQQVIMVRQIIEHIEIPDPIFKQYIIDNYDSNNDGEISTIEALNITSIEVYSDNIESLGGIEHFENLVWLSALPKHNESWGMGVGGGPDSGEWRDSGYYLNGIRVSGKIKELDLSHNPKLQHLDCSGNMITSLDLTNNPMLLWVNAAYNLDLREIIFSPNNSQLSKLMLDSTSIQTIDLTSLVELEYLTIDRGLGLTTLDVSKNKKLSLLDITRNWLTQIDVSNNTMLEQFSCGISPIGALDVSKNVNLTNLDFPFSNVNSIDLSNNTKLETLGFQNANLSNIDISMLPELQNIHFGNYQKVTDSNGAILNVCNTIKDIDLSHNTKLEHLFATLLDLEKIDISNNTELKRIFVEGNLLSELDVSYSPNLGELSAYWNPNLSTIYITPEQRFSYSIDSHTQFAYKGDEVTLYESTDYSKDGEVKQLQAATMGDGIDLVLMGDAYSDRLIADGTYDEVMDTAMEKFFEVEPYKSFRDHFNVYSVTAVSQNEVYSLVSSTAFDGYFGDGTLVGGDDSKAFEYAELAIGEERVDDALIVVMMNSTAYAGTCYMYWPSKGDWGDGVSVSYFPVGEDATALAQVLHHEAGGHGFSKLADEYAYESLGMIPGSEIAAAQSMDMYGWYRNVDFTNDPTQVKWSHFLTDSRYASDGLGVYEGAYTYWLGAYRPTENSIMRYNTGGFNAPSREAIYYRIHKLAYGAEWEYDYEEFVEWDARNRSTASATRGVPYRLDIPEDFKPLHPPVVMKKSWKEATNNAPKKAATLSSSNAGSNLHNVSSSSTITAPKSMTATTTITLPDGTTRTITSGASGAAQTTSRNSTKK